MQSVGVKLEVQDSYQFANLIYTSQDGAEGRRVEAYRLGDTTTYLIADDGAPAVAGINRSEGIDGLKVDGAAFHLFGNKLTVAAGTGIDVGGLSLSADKPVNAQIELDSGKALVESRQEVQLAITDAKAGQQKVQLKPGRHSLSLHPAGGAELQQIAAQMREKLQGMAAAPAAVGKPAAGSGKGVGKLWEHSYPISAEQNKAAGNSKHPCAMMVADADDDGKAEAYVAGKDNALRAIGPDGKELWRYDLPAVIHELAISGKGAARQILIGCDDSNIYALKPDGSLNWSVLVPARSWARPGYAEGDLTLRQGKPVVLVGVDLDGDGNEEIVCGSHYGHVYAFDGNGRLLWDDVTHTPHSMTCGAACDLDGDGKQEVVMGSIYANAIIFSATGGKVGSAGGSGHAGATCAACADLDGDGKGEIAIGDKLGILWLQGPGEDGRWTKSQNMRTYNAGADISAVAMGDVNADGKLEIAAASKNFMLYLFDAAREPIWQLNLGDVCLDIDLADVTGDGKLEVICGCEDGQVKIVNSDGQIIGWYQASDVVWRVRACELDGKPQTKEIVASCDDGKVCGLQIGK